ncbi:hypothetical protein, partial [uncultured Megasphaera sp.]|uniref:hypothetical protein n=1 Tax=uncultured Megasphaera sp. TaxID=165188 RepID=UPI00261FEC0F
PSCVKSIPKSLCKVIIFSLASFDESLIELGADGPPVADRSSQVASEPDAAKRQQIQSNDIVDFSFVIGRSSFIAKTYYYTRIGCG